jgi:hypothetical protein
VRIEELIVDLARSLERVEPLPRPAVRTSRWAALSLAIAAVGIVIIGPRHDIAAAVREPAFAALAALTLLTAFSSAATALVLGVPGAEGRWQRVLPIGAAIGWVGLLIALLAAGGAPVARMLEFPVHTLCIVQIAALSLVPAVAVFDMLRRAAPLQVAWSAGFAALGSLSVGALATQVLCPLDDPAHHLTGHFIPMLIMAAGVVLAAARSLVSWQDRLRRH